MAAQKKEISIVGCCCHLGMSKQAYYKRSTNLKEKNLREKVVISKVQLIRKQQPRIGTRKLYYLLGPEIKVGRDKLFSILRKQDMLIKKRRKYVKTTNSRHWMKTYSDLSKEINLDRAEKLWVSDITYLSTKQGSIYLNLVTDAYSKQIVGYNVSKDLKAESTLKALQMALKKRIYPKRQLVHHSDRGLQYCSKIYVNELIKNNCQISMTQDGSPYDNAVAERINGILKDEFLCDEKFDDFQQAKKHVEQSINTYNSLRPHLSCSLLTPIEMHKQKKLELKKWHKKTSTYYPEVL